MKNNHQKSNKPTQKLSPEWAAFFRESQVLAQTARARRRSHARCSSRGEEAVFGFLDAFTREARLSRAVSPKPGQNPFDGSGEWRFITPAPHPDEGRFDFVCGALHGDFRTPFEKRTTRTRTWLVG